MAPAAASTASELAVPASTDRILADISEPSCAHGASARAAPKLAATSAITKDSTSACGTDAAARADRLQTASAPASAA